MDKPLPVVALIVWVAFTLLVVVSGNDTGTLDVLLSCVTYSIVGAAFGLAADRIALILTDRLPTEDAVSEGAHLNRFRWIVVLVYLATLCAMTFSMWWITEPVEAAARDDGTLMTFVTFILVQIAQGFRWGQLGRHPMAARPDPRP